MQVGASKPVVGVPPVLLSWLPIGVVGSFAGEIPVSVPSIVELGGPCGGFVESVDGGEVASEAQ